MATNLKNKESIQGTKEWIEWRKNHIGGSDIAAIMEISPFPNKNPYNLWLEKTGRHSKSDFNYHMLRGLELEDEAREEYIKQTENFIIPQTLEYKEWQVACASLDGITEEGDLIVEIKCPGEITVKKCRENIIDPHYNMQCQWNMLVANASKCDFFCYGFGNALMKIKADKNLQEELLEKAKIFWWYVENDISPPISEKEYIEIEDEELEILSKNYKKISLEIQKLEKEKSKLKSKIIDFGDDGNFKAYGLIVTKSSGRKKIDWKKICEKYSISNIDLKEFSTQGNAFWSISLKDS